MDNLKKYILSEYESLLEATNYKNKTEEELDKIKIPSKTKSGRKTEVSALTVSKNPSKYPELVDKAKDIKDKIKSKTGEDTEEGPKGETGSEENKDTQEPKGDTGKEDTEEEPKVDTSKEDTEEKENLDSEEKE